MDLLVIEGTGLYEANYPKGYMKKLVHTFTKSPFDDNLNMEERTER
jgi:lathosterol oxidase